MGFMYSAVTLVVLRGVPTAEQGSASSALQLADILGTALGTGVGGAITAVGDRARARTAWAPRSPLVFAASLVASLLGARRDRGGSGPLPGR